MRIAFALVPLIMLALVGPAMAGDRPVFETDVRPIFKAYCLDCHGAGEKMPGGLDLRLKRFAESGGKTGPAFTAKDAAKSLMIERMKSGEMPPGEKKVPPAQIAVIEKWIAAGAPTLREEPATLPPGLGITAEERAHWFYQPLVRPPVPEIRNSKSEIRNEIDAFVLAKLRERGLDFAPDADRATLARRATFDLTGLPPTQKELDEFLADSSPDAYEKLLDRLLASPAYGERWGRHWLDAAGHSDSDGDGTVDTPRPHAWRYRDYVIRALSADRPLDRFVIEQLAGDELVPRPWTNLKPDQIELLSATGFLRTAPESADPEQVVTDTIKIVTSSLLGSSVACAQCHDHRYDPIPQRDYYQLRAVFEPALDPAQWRRPPGRRVSLFTDADRAKAAAIDAEAGKMQTDHDAKMKAAVRAAFEKEIGKFPEAERAKLKAAFDAPADKRTEEQKKLVAANPKLNVTPGVLYQFDMKVDAELKAMQAKIGAKRAERPVEEFVAVLAEVPGRMPATKLFHRGDARQPKGPDLAPADLMIAATEGKRYELPAGDPKAPTSGRRLAWAKHLVNGTHPLFNRVQANRLWLHHFGRGIVDTPGEFGKLGQLPTHPELLDWLATEFPRRGWSLKAMHKLMMTSTVYRQSSTRTGSTGDGALYSRFPLRRLEAEAVRDRMLAVAGRLDRTPFGPPVMAVEDATSTVDVPDDKPRRSIYLQARRSKPVAFLTTFDAPAADLNCERRQSTTSAPQSLTLLNGDFVRKQAGHLAARVLRETTDVKMDADFARRVTTAWRLAYLRAPAADELKLGAAFLRDQSLVLRGRAKDPDLAALVNLCQQLLASNEFLHVD